MRIEHKTIVLACNQLTSKREFANRNDSLRSNLIPSLPQETITTPASCSTCVLHTITSKGEHRHSVFRFFFTRKTSSKLCPNKLIIEAQLLFAAGLPYGLFLHREATPRMERFTLAFHAQLYGKISSLNLVANANYGLRAIYQQL
ncbi:hypothetical protein ElyMa_003568200 [Elysia marginata]|uniref:Uncharacterized protein n=1 Tax=Elysia marginata TaxID=1093978 RepID=A0AAV4EM94_9GAST|nr:hypothetical protein ElyMa_003568200 [Elysia marginata]